MSLVCPKPCCAVLFFLGVVTSACSIGLAQTPSPMLAVPRAATNGALSRSRSRGYLARPRPVVDEPHPSPAAATGLLPLPDIGRAPDEAIATPPLERSTEHEDDAESEEDDEDDEDDDDEEDWPTYFPERFSWGEDAESPLDPDSELLSESLFGRPFIDQT